MFNPDDLSRFANFTILNTPYKTVLGHQITTDILIPSHLASRLSSTPTEGSALRPVLLRFHGGGLVGASSLFPDFFAPWHLELASRHSAIIVSPNYRLLPESSVDEILSDIEDLWVWVQTEMRAFVETQTKGSVSVDTSRIITAGDSAGGYLSLMLGLSHPDEIKAVMASYPMVDVKSRHFTESYEKPMFGLPQLPRSLINDHLLRLRNGEVPSIISSDHKGERAELMFAYVQHGAFKDHFPQERRELFPLDRLEDGARFPRGGVFLWHGKGDTVVPVEGSVKLKEKVTEVDPGLKFRLALEEGDHGFDAQSNIDDGWMAEGLKDIVKVWLA
ncbi:Alpha/Beta hydrolase protein [Bisporella sp. PMI_857]|nr:Alpha/Beta hydrolase protein [Bisporella sp. PMI_857]